jgi:MFS family permease
MQENRPGLRYAFVALQHGGFRQLFIASLVSSFGQSLQAITNLWLIYVITGSALHLGLTGLARAVPLVFFSLVGGVVADRVDRRKVIVLSQLWSGLITLTLGVLAATNRIDVWHIYAATFLGSAVSSLSGPAQRAAIANLVPRHHLMNAMAVNFTTRRFTNIIGPSTGGVLLAAVGAPLTYGLNGVAHLITSVTLARIDFGELPARASGSAFDDLIQGFAFLRVKSIILVILGADGIAMLFGWYQVLLPIIADKFEVGAAGYGFLASASAVGGLLGATAVMSLGDIRYKGLLISGGILLYCCFLVLLALAPWYALAFIAVAGLGLSDSIQTTPRTALVQLLTPDAFRGRVSSFQQLIQAGGPAVGQGAMGAAAGLLTAPVALIGGAAICAVLQIALLVTRRDLRAPDLGSARDEAETEALAVPSPARA